MLLIVLQENCSVTEYIRAHFLCAGDFSSPRADNFCGDFWMRPGSSAVPVNADY